SGQHAPPRSRSRSTRSIAASLVGLEELNVGDIVEFWRWCVGRPPGEVGGSGCPEGERLLLVGVIPTGDIMTDHQRQVIGTQIFLEQSDVDPLFVEHLLFGAI